MARRLVFGAVLMIVAMLSVPPVTANHSASTADSDICTTSAFGCFVELTFEVEVSSCGYDSWGEWHCLVSYDCEATHMAGVTVEGDLSCSSRSDSCDNVGVLAACTTSAGSSWWQWERYNRCVTWTASATTTTADGESSTAGPLSIETCVDDSLSGGHSITVV